ncbi:MAG: hypothetical protein JO163_23475 [Methylobacteriaceae bacterium]|nr:hypothetical protein [Methylobacteriaceae bacterium]MBV9705698.1 hypothetical protein [Methylobacteriaceae bacterium]
MLPGTRILLVACLAVLISSALAQTPPTRIRGTITAADLKTLSVATREGAKVEIALSDKVRVASVKQANLADIAPGTFIGAAAQPASDGKLQALEVVVFPESMRGTGEGHFPWDLTPSSSMTNATVSAVVEQASGRVLSLSYKGGSVEMRVPPDIPIVTPVPAALADLKPGLPVFVVANKAAGGDLTAAFIAVGKDGVAPPM